MSSQIKRVIKVISLLLLAFIICIVSLAYLRYRDVKKALIVKIADEATSFIGQKVEIGDLSIGTASGINIYDISVKNPEGFISGELLRIKKLHLKMRYSDLAGRKFYFQNITVYSPEITLIRDQEGRMNISDKLRDFFKRKPTIKYQVDEFTINSGFFDFNKDKKYRTDNINIYLKNLSSDPGTKTQIKGSASYAGGRIGIDGWAYLKDEPRKVKLSISSDEISLAGFKALFNSYKINTERTKLAANLEIEGDTESGVNLKSEIHIKNAGISFLRNEMKNILFDTEAFLNIRENSILIKEFSLSSDEILSLRSNALVTHIIKNPVISSEIKIHKIDLSAFNIREDFAASGIMTSDTIHMKGTLRDMKPEITGTVFIKNASLKKDNKRNIFKDASLHLRFYLKGEDMGFKADTNIGKIFSNISGKIKRVLQKDRIMDIKIAQPEVNVTDIRDAFWEIFPDSLLYAGLNGSISSDILIFYSGNTLSKINGNLRLKNLVLQGENGEYAVGPVNGVVPIAYGKTNTTSSPPFRKGGQGGFDDKKEIRLPSFERTEFGKLKEYYLQETLEVGYNKITVGSLSYGFRFLDNISLWMKQEDNILNIKHFSGNIPGGRFDGAAAVDISNGLTYRVGFILEGLSLTKLCENIEPIKGYISGKVDGIANLKGHGTGISQLIGKADFWSYSTKEEKTRISKEFLQRVGGPSLGAYLRDRNFNKGEMSLYLQNGYVIFKELEISNRNILGIQDLSVKVAPLNNRIAIDHLMWSITEAASRAQKN